MWLQKTWKLIAATCVPLALTSAKHDSAAFALGTVLSLTVARITYTLPAAGAMFDAKQEQAAIDAVRVTSTPNRVIRVLHGVTFVYAAFNFAKRWRVSVKQPLADDASKGLQAQAAQVGWMAVGALATFWLCRVGCGFAATGVMGQ